MKLTISFALAMAMALPGGSARAAAVFLAPPNVEALDAGSGGGTQLPEKDGIVGVKLFGDSTTTQICTPGSGSCTGVTSITWHGEGIDFFGADHVDLSIQFHMQAIRTDGRPLTDLLHANLNFTFFDINGDEDAVLFGATRDYIFAEVSPIGVDITDTLTVTGVPVGSQLGLYQVVLTNTAFITLDPLTANPFSLLVQLTVPGNSIDINPVGAPEPTTGVLGAGLLALLLSHRRRAV